MTSDRARAVAGLMIRDRGLLNAQSVVGDYVFGRRRTNFPVEYWRAVAEEISKRVQAERKEIG